MNRLLQNRPLGEICKEVYRYPSYYGITYVEEGVPEIRGELIRKDGTIETDRTQWRFIGNTTAEGFPRTALEAKDLVMSVRGTIGKVGLVPLSLEGANITANLMRISPHREMVEPRYLWHFMRTERFRAALNHVSPSTTIKTIRAPDLKAVPVPLPPLAEQKRIAAILDKAENLRRKRQDAIRLTEEFLRSTFLDIFGDPVTNPKGWEVHTIGALASRITKGESPKWQGYTYQDNGVRFITSENVLWGRLDSGRAKWISEEFHQKLKRSQVRSNDVLINLVGASVGRTCLVPNEVLPANINQAVAVVSLNKQVCEPSFLLSQLLTASVQRRLLGEAVDFARANISLTNIRELSVVVPPLEYQRKWKHLVQRHQAAYQRKTASAKELNDLFNSLVQRAFRGDL